MTSRTCRTERRKARRRAQLVTLTAGLLAFAASAATEYRPTVNQQAVQHHYAFAVALGVTSAPPSHLSVADQAELRAEARADGERLADYLTAVKVAANAPRASPRPIPARTAPRRSQANTGSRPSGSVAQCVKNHESGNYNESSHPGSGSGAYQFIPGTWRSYSRAAGYPGYSYAYQAPASVQDAVFQYALTHGGAGNWSSRWGNDPCTSGLPGGG